MELQWHKSAVKRGKVGIIRSYKGIAQRSRRRQPERSDPGGGGLPGQPALCVIFSMKFIIKRQSIYLLLYISPAYSYILYILFPAFSLSPFLSQLRVSGTPLLWLQSDLWYSPIAIFKIALKIKKTPAVLSARALSWKNLQLGLLAIPLYHISALIARKIPPAEARGIFPEKGYDGKPSECLSLFAVLMLHNDGIFTAFVVHSGIVFASFIASNKT